MNTKKRTMHMRVEEDSVLDVDALIAGADPLSTKSQFTSGPVPAAPAKSKEKKLAPWEHEATKGRVNMPLYVTPQIKAMLDFLRQETGVPSQVTLRKIIEPELRKQCEQVHRS